MSSNNINHDTHHANDARLVEQVQRALEMIRAKPSEWAGQVEDLIARNRSGANLQSVNIWIKDCLSFAEVAENTGFSPDDPLKTISQALVAGSAYKRVRIKMLSSCYQKTDLDFFGNGNIQIHIRGFTLGFEQYKQKLGSVVQGSRSMRFYNIKQLGIELSGGNLTYRNAVKAVSSPHWTYSLRTCLFAGTGHAQNMNVSIIGNGMVHCIDANGDTEVPGLQTIVGNFYNGSESARPAGKQGFHSTNVCYTWARSISSTQKVTEHLNKPKAELHYRSEDFLVTGNFGNVNTIIAATNPISMNYAHDDC